ncbi:linker for activation of T-cells family member 2 isoform X3 [Python bivittatus]|uniref:Linker for activation of T-cells family member 2 isoform X3 n=1 Tax=Python bivittatus TaxID=176946 RepID=A0A9F5J2E9_PYTBI|nr:linker for activation of T-cells family member 2 isoform X3 [Python bivittatus]
MGQVELIWGAFSLMMLGALISMCMKCQQTGSKQVKANVDSHRTQCEDREDFQQLPYLSSASRQPQVKGMYGMARPSQSRELSSLNDLEIQTEQDPTYVEPISSDHYYNSQKVTRLSSEDSSNGYQNVTGTLKSSGHVLADIDIYENSLAIQIWKHSQISESSNVNFEEEPTYINTESYSRRGIIHHYLPESES